MARTLPTSIAIAMTTHALLVVCWPAEHTEALDLDLPADANPSEPSATTASSIAEPFAIEFVTLPPAPKANKSIATTSPSARRTPKTAPARARVPAKTGPPKRVTTSPAPPAGLLQGHDKGTTKASPTSGFSLSMRTEPLSGLSGRAGSLLDEVIGSIPVPSEEGQSRGDLIATEARIGLDSQATRSTQWRDSGGGSMTSVGEPFTANIASDGTIRFRDHDNVKAKVVRWGGIPMPMIAGGFDATDAAMAAFGEVLYPFRKLKAMDQTRDHRASMALRARGKSLQSALRRFRLDLKKIWGDSALPVEERRAIIFALWDECAEEGPEEVVKTAASIRASVVRFVVRSLPADSADAFTPEELNLLNAGRQSAQLFAPYDD